MKFKNANNHLMESFVNMYHTSSCIQFCAPNMAYGSRYLSNFYRNFLANGQQIPNVFVFHLNWLYSTWYKKLVYRRYIMENLVVVDNQMITKLENFESDECNLYA